MDVILNGSLSDSKSDHTSLVSEAQRKGIHFPRRVLPPPRLSLRLGPAFKLNKTSMAAG